MHGHTQIKRVVSLDFESHYSAEFSLSKMPMQAYIEDPRFHIIGVAAIEDFADGTTGRYGWMSGPNSAAQFLRNLRLDEPGTLTVAQNAMFDGGILEFHLGIKPWMYCCTMMGARPHLVPRTPGNRMSLSALAQHVDVGAKQGYVVKAKGLTYADFDSQQLSDYGDYCLQDTEICRALGKRILRDLPWDELRLIDLTIKMFTRPKLQLDKAVLSAYLKRIREEKANLLDSVGVDAPELRSNQKFADLLVRHGVADLPTKMSPTTGEVTYAFAKTDKEFKEKVLEHPNETVQLLGAARVGHKSSIAESRAERFLELADLPGGFGCPLLYYGAHSGRFSGYDKLNLQNLPRGNDLRRALCAPKGQYVISVDLSQIETRVLAWLAGEQKLLDVFAAKADPYRAFAAEVYQVPLNQVDGYQRRVAKSALLGLGYGMGADKFAEYLQANGITDLPMRFIKTLVYTNYRGAYRNIVELWDRASGGWMTTLLGLAVPLKYKCLFIAEGFIGLPNGMAIHYHDLANRGTDGLTYGVEGKRRRLYGPKVIENAVQALARIVLTDAMLYLAKHNIFACLSIHDELLYVANAYQAKKLIPILKNVLRCPVAWMPGLVLDSEVKVGRNYGDMREVKI